MTGKCSQASFLEGKEDDKWRVIFLNKKRRRRRKEKREQPTKEDDGSGNPCSESHLQEADLAVERLQLRLQPVLSVQIRELGGRSRHRQRRPRRRRKSISINSCSSSSSSSCHGSLNSNHLPQIEKKRKKTEKTADGPTQRTSQKQRSRPSKHPSNNKIRKSIIREMGEVEKHKLFWSRRERRERLAPTNLCAPQLLCKRCKNDAARRQMEVQ